MRQILCRTLVALATVVIVAGSAGAADKRPLPASRVQTVDGASLTLDQAGPESRVYVYVLPGSTTSARLLTALRDWQLEHIGQVTLVVGGPRETAVAFAAANHGLQGVQWLIDADRAFWTDMQITGVPTLFGVRGGVVEWRLAGVLNEPGALKGVVSSWTTAP
ncbi:MAG: hypothetical protein QM736_02940 [Vicinamibacterales bacterium]